jgi:hypothetical protein
VRRQWFQVVILLLSAVGSPAAAQLLVNIAEDTAGNYEGGWESGANGGYGFEPWQLRARSGDKGSYAGFFIAHPANHARLENIARRRAFGMYANGVEFEEAVAFRSFQRPLQAGDAFSLLLKHGRIRTGAQKGAVEPGSVGVSLRSGHADADVADQENGYRFQFVYVEGARTYRIRDGEEQDKQDSGLSVTEEGIELIFIYRGGDRYDLKVKVIETDEVHEWKSRRLAGESGALIESVAMFNRNGEPENIYFEGLQINQEQAAEKELKKIK